MRLRYTHAARVQREVLIGSNVVNVETIHWREKQAEVNWAIRRSPLYLKVREPTQLCLLEFFIDSKLPPP